MAITDIVLSGKLYQDDGDAVSGATVALLETGTTTSEATTTTDSNGAWTFTEPDLDTTYDIKITSGTSVRYILWSDEITTKGVDTASLKVRGANAAAAPIYIFADRADTAGMGWRIQATTSHTLAIGSDKASAGTIIDYLTITNGANAAASVAAFGGDLTVGDDLSLTSDSAVFKMGADSGFSITHDGDIGATIAGSPITITAAEASTWSTSSGALTITSAAALNLNPAGGSAILLDGTISVDAGVVTGATSITSTAIELGHASDTTIARSGSGAITVEGTQVLLAGAALTGSTIDATTDFTIGDTVITNGVITDTSGLSIAAAVDLGANTLTSTGSMQIRTIDYSDGDLAMTIADGGGVTFAQNVSLADAANVSISTPLLANADHTTTGITAEMLAGAAIAAFDLVCIHTTTQEVNVADASAVATARAIGIAPAAISDTATGTVLLKGFIRDDTWNWTTGSVLYLSETAGEMTHTAPTTDGAFVQTVGIALEPDVVYINPSLDILEHA